MKLFSILAASLLIGVIANSQAKDMTQKQFDKCVAKAEASVDQQKEGMWAVEAAVKSQCGDSPITEPKITTGAVGLHPYDLVRSKAWKKQFMAITRGKYQSFVDKLVMSEKTMQQGEWITGEGFAAHSGGSEEAAFAINIESGKVYAAMLEGGSIISGFGFDPSWGNAPTFLKQWAAERKN